MPKQIRILASACKHHSKSRRKSNNCHHCKRYVMLNNYYAHFKNNVSMEERLMREIFSEGKFMRIGKKNS